ncbi:MAG: hypothetical protein ACTS2F_02825 [Thainema sp.]
MQPSMEARWFWPHQIPAPVRDWWVERNHHYPTHNFQPTVESRTDWYLRLPQHIDLSIKLREGQIEVKQRICDRGIQLLSPSIHGHVGQWIKWSFPLAEAATTIQKRFDQKEQWIAVAKTRQSKTYYLADNGATENGMETAIAFSTSGDSFDQQHHAGCSVEIAEVIAFDQRWFSLGIEAFGTVDTVASVFDQVCPSIFADNKLEGIDTKLVLEPAHSLSYPQWLAAALQSQSVATKSV